MRPITLCSSWDPQPCSSRHGWTRAEAVLGESGKPARPCTHKSRVYARTQSISAAFRKRPGRCISDSQKRLLACGFFNSGIRVFDIRDPKRPKEIAYHNPPGTTTPSPGSNHFTTAQWRAGGPDWCSAQVHLDRDTGTVWSTCQDNGMLMLKFTNGVWPFPESSTLSGKQN
jgi:hypothetical protein